MHRPAALRVGERVAAELGNIASIAAPFRTSERYQCLSGGRKAVAVGNRALRRRIGYQSVALGVRLAADSDARLYRVDETLHGLLLLAIGGYPVQKEDVDLANNAASAPTRNTLELTGL